MKKKDIPVLKYALFNRCPACGKGKVYSALLTVSDKCEKCGFALKEHDAGDGPAFFVMFISGTLVTIFAAIVEIYFSIPLWLHMVIWSPIVLIMSVYLLKVAKSLLIGLQYKYNVLGFRKGGKK